METYVTNKKIRVGNTEFRVIDCYVTRHLNDKPTLVVSVSEDEALETDIKLLKDNKYPIEYYEQIITTITPDPVPEIEIMDEVEGYEHEVVPEDETEKVIVGEWEKKITYEGFGVNYICSYRDGVYTAEIARISDTDRAIEQNRADIAFVAVMTGVELV